MQKLTLLYAFSHVAWHGMAVAINSLSNIFLSLYDQKLDFIPYYGCIPVMDEIEYLTNINRQIFFN